MKKLQNNFTTPEQSKRLLELGVPADSADCYYSRTIKCIIVIDTEINKKEFFKGDIVPCWSVGRLMEIFTICAEYHTGGNSLVFNKESVLLGNIDCLIPVIELAAKDKCIDFSKLEE